jgi:uncharacterized oxidoreductase
MNLNGNTVLVTGGGSGIGFALARRFAKAGSQVIICGRRREQLEKAAKEQAGLHPFVCNVSTPTGRARLFEQVVREFPKLNVLINNAGIQNRPPPLIEKQAWESTAQEIATNLDAPIHLSMLFAPFLAKQQNPAIINVSSGLAFSPLAFMPIYCATKAALHSFTLSLRHQLKSTQIKVIEIIPPAVNTDLGGKGLHTTGTPLDEFADHIMKQIEMGELEFGFGFSEKARLASRDELNALFNNMNK